MVKARPEKSLPDSRRQWAAVNVEADKRCTLNAGDGHLYWLLAAVQRLNGCSHLSLSDLASSLHSEGSGGRVDRRSCINTENQGEGKHLESISLASIPAPSSLCRRCYIGSVCGPDATLSLLLLRFLCNG